jgi:hypothetical protein
MREKTYKLPLAQDYVTVYKVPDDFHYIHHPAIGVLPDNSIIAFTPCWSTDMKIVKNTIVSKSFNKGETWEVVCTLPYSDMTPFVFDGS